MQFLQGERQAKKIGENKFLWKNKKKSRTASKVWKVQYKLKLVTKGLNMLIKSLGLGPNMVVKQKFSSWKLF